MFDSYGDAYWMVDMEMDCSRTKDGWFEVKGFSNGGRFPIRVCFFSFYFTEQWKESVLCFLFTLQWMVLSQTSIKWIARAPPFRIP